MLGRTGLLAGTASGGVGHRRSLRVAPCSGSNKTILDDGKTNPDKTSTVSGYRQGGTLGPPRELLSTSHILPTTYPFPIQAVGANPFLCRRDTRLKRVVRAA